MTGCGTGNPIVVAAAESVPLGSGVMIGTAEGSRTLSPHLLAEVVAVDVVGRDNAAAVWVLEERRHVRARPH